MKRLLELFCGTKSVGKVFEPAGYEVVSLDYDTKFDATHTEDILAWDYKQYPVGHFDVIWASPDCTTWTIATGGKYRTKSNNWGFPKPTNIWSNLILWNEQAPEMPEDSYTLHYHGTNQSLKRYYIAYKFKNGEERSKIPPDLVQRLRLLIPNEV